MLPGLCFNEFPISTSEEMTYTYNGDTIDYSVSIKQENAEELHIEQEKELEIYIDQQVDLTLEN
jgi:hypothetical protein